MDLYVKVIIKCCTNCTLESMRLAMLRTDNSTVTITQIYETRLICRRND